MDIEFHLENLSEYAQSVHKQIVRWSLIRNWMKAIGFALAVAVLLYLPLPAKLAKYTFAPYIAILIIAYKSRFVFMNLLQLYTAPKLWVVEYLTEMDIEKARAIWE